MILSQVVGDKLEQVIDMVAQVAKDPHPRVVFAVADAIGSLAEVFDVRIYHTANAHTELLARHSPT